MEVVLARDTDRRCAKRQSAREYATCNRGQADPLDIHESPDYRRFGANPSFGQGVEGYAKRFGTTYADFAIENIMTEGLFPTLFHQDPRYFRRGAGTSRSRVAYAMSRLFFTRGDSGSTQFNFSEVVGAAASVALSNLYYPDGRTVGNNVGKYTEQLGFDAASNVLKKFWPDLKRKLVRRHSASMHDQ